MLHARNGKLERARVLLTDALTRHREVGNRASEGIVLGNLGQLNEELGDIVAARTCLEAARDLAKATGHTQAEGLWLSELARVVQGPEAEGWLRRAETILREAGNPALLAVTLATKAEMLHRLGAGDKAQAVLDEAEALAPEGDEGVTQAITRAMTTLAAH